MIKQFKCTKCRPTNGQCFPTSREGLSLTYIAKPHHVLIMFGGISSGRMNDIMVYDIKGQIWRNQETKGRQPSPRCYHSAFYDQTSECLFIYGGQGDKGRSLSDFYILNINNFIWKRLFLLEVPQNRHNHSLNDLNNYEREKIIFGGACAPENILLNDVWTFNYSGITFQSTLPEIPGASCTLRQTKGDIPSGRKGHSAVIYQKNLYIFGGKTDDADQNTAILHQLSIETYTWKKIQTMGKTPTPRAFMTSSMFGNDRIFIFGGLDNKTNKVLNETYILNLKDFNWNQPFFSGPIPTPRYLHASAIIDNKQDNIQIIILGGLDQSFCSMDFYNFQEVSSQSNIEWEQIHEPTQQEEKTIQLAGSTIIDGEKYLLEIEEAMIRERKKAIELKKELDQCLQEQNNLQNYIQKRENEIKQKHQTSQQDCSNTQTTIETIFLMIKQEQMISKEIQSKIQMIEDILQKIQNYLILLDQLYSQLRRNKLDESDPREHKLKKVNDAFSDEYNKTKEENKQALSNLKQNYEKSTLLLSKVEVDLTKKRKDIYESNKEYEQLIFDTETEEYQ